MVGAQEDRNLLFRDRDENAIRHAGTVALHDWCWGGDDQRLYSGVFEAVEVAAYPLSEAPAVAARAEELLVKAGVGRLSAG